MARHGVAELLDMAREAGSSGTRTASRLASEARAKGRDASSELSDLWSRIEDLFHNRVTPAAQDAASQAGAYWRDSRDYAADATERLRESTRAHPLLAVGIAVAATWLVTSILHGRRSR